MLRSSDRRRLDPSHKPHNASATYPTMHHFVTEMCTRVHISVTKWYIAGYRIGALWDMRPLHYWICEMDLLIWHFTIRPATIWQYLVLLNGIYLTTRWGNAILIHVSVSITFRISTHICTDVYHLSDQFDDHFSLQWRHMRAMVS